MTYFATYRAQSIATIAAALDADLDNAAQANAQHENDTPAARAGLAAYLATLSDAPDGKVWAVTISGNVGGIQVSLMEPFVATGQTFNIAAGLEDDIPADLLAQVA